MITAKDFLSILWQILKAKLQNLASLKGTK